MMEISQASHQAPPISISSQQQLSRSKSLNDLSDDSHLIPFSSTRCINLQNAVANMSTNGRDSACPYMQLNSDVHSNGNFFLLDNQNPVKNSGGCSTNMFDNLSSGNSANLSSNLMSSDVSQYGRPDPANRFNLCNHIPNNLSSVTEQIGNLHL